MQNRCFAGLIDSVQYSSNQDLLVKCLRDTTAVVNFVAPCSRKKHALPHEHVVEIHSQNCRGDLVCPGPFSETGKSSGFVTPGPWLPL